VDLPFAAVELFVADLDGDLDLAFAVFDRDGMQARILENLRGGRFRESARTTWPRGPAVTTALLCDLDGDALPEIAMAGTTSLRLLRNRGLLSFEEDLGFRSRHEGRGGKCLVAVDLRGSLRTGLLVLGGEGEAAERAIYIEGADAESLTLDFAGPRACASAAVVFESDATGPRPRLMLYDVQTGLRSFGLEPEGGWIGLRLRGAVDSGFDFAADGNSSALGARIEVVCLDRRVVVQADPAAGGSVRSLDGLLFGLAGNPAADLMSILWPDGALDAASRLEASRLHEIEESMRTTERTAP
jgi:hypothetical protein